MAKLTETTKVDYDFQACRYFHTGDILVRLIRNTKIGNHPTKVECAKPAKLEWREVEVGENCDIFLTIPEHEPSELSQAKETEVSYWIRRALRFFITKNRKTVSESSVISI
ncbi:MAG TPA: hypothetical protein ENI23_16440 [bacterium]|nr:hypothetical protein [bacterium]